MAEDYDSFMTIVCQLREDLVVVRNTVAAGNGVIVLVVAFFLVCWSNGWRTNKATDRGFHNGNFNARSNFDVHRVAITRYFGDFADDAAAGNDLIALFEASKHSLMLFHTALLRANEHEIEYKENQNERQKAGKWRSGRHGCCSSCIRRLRERSGRKRGHHQRNKLVHDAI